MSQDFLSLFDVVEAPVLLQQRSATNPLLVGTLSHAVEGVNDDLYLSQLWCHWESESSAPVPCMDDELM